MAPPVIVFLTAGAAGGAAGVLRLPRHADPPLQREEAARLSVPLLPDRPLLRVERLNRHKVQPGGEPYSDNGDSRFLMIMIMTEKI